jgi:hypothetical protein
MFALLRQFAVNDKTLTGEDWRWESHKARGFCAKAKLSSRDCPQFAMGKRYEICNDFTTVFSGSFFRLVSLTDREI